MVMKNISKDTLDKMHAHKKSNDFGLVTGALIDFIIKYMDSKLVRVATTLPEVQRLFMDYKGAYLQQAGPCFVYWVT